MVKQMRAEPDKVCAALAAPLRRQVVELLAERPRAAGELAELFSVSPPAISRHLNVLREGGLVEEQRPDGDRRVRLYRLRQEPLDGLSAWIERVSGFWDDRLAAFKQHVERPEGEGSRR